VKRPVKRPVTLMTGEKTGDKTGEKTGHISGQDGKKCSKMLECTKLMIRKINLLANV
jgi:hypothetical protein